MTETFEPDMGFDARSNDIDVGALGSAIYRKRYWILIPTVLGFLLAATSAAPQIRSFIAGIIQWLQSAGKG